MRLRIIGLVMLLAAVANASWAQTPDPQNYRLVVRVPRKEANDWLKEEVGRSHGDLDHDRYHFILGFSTGHYGSDPVQAIATRRLAFSLLNNTFAPGDKVTPLAWEMNLWHQGEPITLSSDPLTRAAFVDAVPYAPAPNSRGGHDTERALYETLTKGVPAIEAKSTIVILLTNSNQSMGPTGARAQLFGANNPQLSAEIRKLGFREPVRHSFSAETRSGKVGIDVTALFPQKIASLPGAPTGSRFPSFAEETWQPAADRPAQGEALPNPAAPPEGGVSHTVTVTPGPSGGTIDETYTFSPPLIPIVIGLIVLLIIAAVVAWLMSRKAKQPVAAVEKPRAPKGRPIPGAVAVTLGTAPSDVKQSLKPLTTTSRWLLLRDGSTAPSLAPVTDEEPPAGTRLATVAFDAQNRLQVTAEPDAQFQEIRGTATKSSSSRVLLLAPGDQMICNLVSATSAGAPTRLEIRYQRQG